MQWMLRAAVGLLLLLPAMGFTESLTLWHVHEHQRAFIHTLIGAFNAKSKVPIEVNYIELDDLQLSLIKGVIDNRAPDIIFIPSDKTGIDEFKLSKIPSDWLSPQISAQNYDTVRIHGDFYGAPVLGGNHLMLYYNKAYIQTPAATWDELFKQQANLTRQGVKLIGWNYHEMYWLAGFIGAYGGWPLENGQLALDTEGVREGLTFYKMLSDKGYVPADCDYDCSTKRFYAGEFAYTINGDWAYLEAKQQLGDNFGVALIPRIENKVVTPMFSTMALAFPNHSLEGKHSAVLKQFIQYMQSPEVQAQWVAQGRFPVHQQVIAGMIDNADPNLQVFLQQLAQSRAMPPDSAMTDAWLSLSKWFTLFMTGNISVAQTTQMMQSFAIQQQNKRNEH